MDNERAKQGFPRVGHYYGDIVRRLFLAGGIIMVICLPYFNDLLPVPLVLSLLAIVSVAFIAGIMNPTQYSVSVSNVGISLIAVIAFEYHAVSTYIRFQDLVNAGGLIPEYTNRLFLLFIAEEVLAIVFFLALYYSSKTWRGMYLKSKTGSFE